MSYLEKKKSVSYPSDALKQAEIVRMGWNEVGRRLLVPNLDLDRFIEKLSEAQALVDKAEALKAQRAQAIQQRNVCLSELWDLTKRIRHSAKATFGDYSPELDVLTNGPLMENDESPNSGNKNESY